MAAPRAGLHGTVGQPSAQVIDGSLDFNGESQNSYILKTFGSAGTEETWTVSVWFRIDDVSNQNHLFSSGANSSNRAQVTVESDGSLNCEFQSGGSVQSQKITTRRLRDPGGWYHLVVAVNTNDGTAEDRMKIYINGVRETSFSTNTLFSSGDVTQWMKAIEHNIGKRTYSTDYFDGRMSQFYCIDGSQLTPSDFGFTDPLTNTWRPKKYTGTFGTNGFWLPLDGNSPIGEDKSGNGNNFTPIRFGGSNSIEKATGAFPILNTINGGRVATAGVRTDTNVGAAATCVLALPLNDGTAKLDVSNQINGGSSEKTITINGNAAATNTQSNFYGGSFTFDGTGDYLTTPANTDFDFGTGAYTIEMWFRTTQDSGWLFYNASSNTGMRMCVGSNGTNAANAGKIEFNEQVSNGDVYTRGTSRVDNGKWHHVAVCRGSSGGTRLYVNGNLEATGNSGRNFDNDNLVYIGARESLTGNEFNGQLQDLRVYKGVEKYTDNFVVGSTDPDVLPDTPSGVSGSSKLTKITDGSVSFDGGGDYLTVPNHADLRFGSGDFCVEAFVYYSETSGNGTIAGLWNSGSNRRSWLFQIESDNRRLRGFYSTDGSSSTAINATTGQMTRNAWHHVAYTRNGTTLRIFLDGVEVGSQTSESGTLYDNSDDDIGVGSAQGGAEADPITGFISNVRIVKGSAVYTSDFTPPAAPLTNITNTKLLCCQTYTDRTTAAVIPTGSITGNGNAQGNTFNPFTTDISAVRGQESGYAVLSPVSFRGNGSITNGNLTMAANSSGDCSAAATLQIPTGTKIYLEAQHNITAGNGNRAQIGVVNVNVDTGANARPGDAAGGWAYDFSTSDTNSGAYDEGSRTAGPDADDGDICMWCIDLSAGLMWAGKNGQWFSTGNPSTGAGAVITGIPDTATSLKFSVDGGASNRSQLIYNFGQKPFKYNPPEGFQPLCLANLERPTSPAAVRPETYVGIHTYVGTGSEHDIPSAFGFDPDFLWTRRSDATGGVHNWYDKVRGDDGTRMYVICPNTTTSQATRTEATTAMVRSSQWPRHGFRVGTNTQTNGSGALYTAFGLKAGGAPVSNTDGSITTQVSASPESGFSIIGYTGNTTTGASIGHGLNQAPEMLIFKSLSEDRTWLIWHKDINDGRGDYYLKFNTEKRTFDSRTDRPLKDTGCTTATTIILGLDSEVNHNNDMICYAFHSVPGVVKVGSYDGNGSTTDGPFVDCGFRPKFVIAKNNSGGSETNWFVKDAENAKFNPLSFTLYLNTDDVRQNNFPIDFYSNGFKMRDDNALINESGSDYIYIAFADTPTQTLYGGQSNAR